jgi:RimJ/RimL family protein N-acetyltransferase
VAREEKLHRLTAALTPDNAAMRSVFEKLGFSLQMTDDNKLVLATREL